MHENLDDYGNEDGHDIDTDVGHETEVLAVIFV